MVSVAKKKMSGDNFEVLFNLQKIGWYNEATYGSI